MTDQVAVINELYDDTAIAFVKTIPFDQLVFDPRAEYMCKFGCKNYGRKYSCPPQSLTVLEDIRSHNYKWAILFATTHAAREGCTRYQLRAFNRLRELEIQQICTRVAVHLSNNGSNDMLLSGGSCKACRECSLWLGHPCKKPHRRQVSMEAIGIDCQRTLHGAGFDFEMPNTTSANRCGCILTDDDDLAEIDLRKRESLQKYEPPTLDTARRMCTKLKEQYPDLLASIELVDVRNIPSQAALCEGCSRQRHNFSCPPYSSPMSLDNWSMAVLWKWRSNSTKKARYNVALRIVHSAFFSLGFYFALSLRDCYCDECALCSYPHSPAQTCVSRKTLAPSIQSQGIDPTSIGPGKYGLELL